MVAVIDFEKHVEAKKNLDRERAELSKQVTSCFDLLRAVRQKFRRKYIGNSYLTGLIDGVPLPERFTSVLDAVVGSDYVTLTVGGYPGYPEKWKTFRAPLWMFTGSQGDIAKRYRHELRVYVQTNLDKVLSDGKAERDRLLDELNRVDSRIERAGKAAEVFERGIRK